MTPPPHHVVSPSLVSIAICFFSRREKDTDKRRVKYIGWQACEPWKNVILHFQVRFKPGKEVKVYLVFIAKENWRSSYWAQSMMNSIMAGQGCLLFIHGSFLVAQTHRESLAARTSPPFLPLIPIPPSFSSFFSVHYFLLCSSFLGL